MLNERLLELTRRVEISINPAIEASEITQDQVLQLMKKIGTTHKERRTLESNPIKVSPVAAVHQAVQQLRAEKLSH